MKDVPEILKDAAALFESRNSEYSGNGRQAYERHGDLMTALFGDRLNPKTPEDHARLGVLTQIISKLSRYATNFHKGGHKDSARDLIVYAAMLDKLTAAEQPQQGLWRWEDSETFDKIVIIRGDQLVGVVERQFVGLAKSIVTTHNATIGKTWIMTTEISPRGMNPGILKISAGQHNFDFSGLAPFDYLENRMIVFMTAHNAGEK